MRRQKEELEQVKEDDEENKYFGDRIRGDKLSIFEFVKNTKTSAQRLNKTMVEPGEESRFMKEHRATGGGNNTTIMSAAKRTAKKATQKADAASSKYIRHDMAFETMNGSKEIASNRSKAFSAHSNRTDEDRIGEKQQKLVNQAEAGRGEDPESGGFCTAGPNGEAAMCTTF